MKKEIEDPYILVKFTIIETKDNKPINNKKELRINIFEHSLLWKNIFSLFGEKIKEILKINNDLIKIDYIDINRAIKMNYKILNRK
jgi:hypothetical protein